jgi:hypothetical protein
VVFGDSGGNYLTIFDANTTLTIEPGITVRGRVGRSVTPPITTTMMMRGRIPPSLTKGQSRRM